MTDTDANAASPGLKLGPSYTSRSTFRESSSRAYENLQRIGAISFTGPGKQRRLGHRHTHSTPVFSNTGLSPIPSLSSIATTTSAESSTLSTPTSTVYPHHAHAIHVVRGDQRALEIEIEEEEEDIPTPTPSPKAKARLGRFSNASTASNSSPTAIATLSNTLSPSPSPSRATANFIRKLSSLRRSSTASSYSPPLIKHPKRAKPTLAMPAAISVQADSCMSPARANARSPRALHVQVNGSTDRNANGVGVGGHVGMGVGDRRGQPHPHLQQLPPNPHAQPYTQPHPTVNLNLRAPKPRRATVPNTPMTTMSVPSSPSLPKTPASPSSASSVMLIPQYRPPSRSERLLRSTLLKDEMMSKAAAASSANPSGGSLYPHSPLSSSSSSVSFIASPTAAGSPSPKVHKRRHSSHAVTAPVPATASATAYISTCPSPPSSKPRRIRIEEFEDDSDDVVDPALVGASFLFRSAITNASSSPRTRTRASPSPSPSRSSVTQIQSQGQRRRYAGDAESENHRPAADVLSRSRSSTPRPGMKICMSEPGPLAGSRSGSGAHTHNREAYPQLPLYDGSGYSSGSAKRPMTPHEQVLRARLERILVGVGESVGVGERGCGCAECQEQEEMDDWERRERERRKKRVSLPSENDMGRRVGSGSGLFGWLWKGESEEQAPGYGQTRVSSDFEPEFINPLPTPSTPPPPPRTFRQGVSEVRTPDRNINARRERAYTAPTPNCSPSVVAGLGSPGKFAQKQQQQQAQGQKHRHVFSLETVPSVDELKAKYDSASGSGSPIGSEESVAAEDAHGARKDGESEESEGDMRMITPPPTPPRKNGEVLDPCSDTAGSNPVKSHSRDDGRISFDGRRSVRKDGMGLGLGRPSTRASTSTNITTSDASSGSSSIDALGLISPQSSKAVVPNGNAVALEETTTSSSSSSLDKMTSSVESSTSGFGGKRSPNKAQVRGSPRDISSLSPSEYAYMQLSPGSQGFNARTASAQCRLVEGYVSFSEVEGLGEPPASAHPSMCEDGDDYFFDGKGRRGEDGGVGKGWIGRLFGAK